jgi:hypothetical protein
MKFEDLKLNYGYSLQLQTINLAGQTERFSCRLIGCLPGRSILLSVPKVDGKLVRFRTNQKIVVRLMIDNGIGVFACLVEEQTSTPYPILHLGYPEQVTFKGIRSATRVAVAQEMIAFNHSANSTDPRTGAIVDISISGARIELVDTFADIGDKLELRAQVSIRDIPRELILIGVVKSKGELGEGANGDELQNFGIEFTKQSDEQQLLIYTYVFNQMSLQDYYVR